MQIQNRIKSSYISPVTDIEKYKSTMKSMSFFQAFSPDGFHQTFYAKLNRTTPKACIIFNANDLHHIDLSYIVDICQNNKSQSNIALAITNDIYFNKNCSFLAQEHIEHIVAIVPGNETYVIVGQPTHVMIKLIIESKAFSHIDKLMTHITSMSIDSRYFEMCPTHIDLASINSNHKPMMIELDMHINHQTKTEAAMKEFKEHIQQYLYDYSVDFDIQYEVMNDGFYNHNIHNRYKLLKSVEQNMSTFVNCIASNEEKIPSYLLASSNILGISYNVHSYNLIPIINSICNI